LATIPPGKALRVLKTPGGIILILVILAILCWPLEERVLGMLVQSAVNGRITGRCSFSSWRLGFNQLEITSLVIKDSDGREMAVIPSVDLRFSFHRLLTSSPLAAVERLTLRQPHITVDIDSKGVSNWSRLTRPAAKPPAPPRLPTAPVALPFQGQMEVIGGSVDLQDASRGGITARLDDISLLLSGDLSGRITVTANLRDAAPHDGFTAAIQGWLLTAPPQTSLHCRIQGADLYRWGNWIANTPDFKFLGGRGDIDALLYGQAPDLSTLLVNPSYQGVLRLEDTLCRIRGVPGTFVDVGGKVAITYNHLDVKELRGRYGDSPLEMTGTLHDFLHAQLDFMVRSSAMDFRDLSRMLSATYRLPLEGRGRGWVRIRGPGQKLTWDAHILGDPLILQGEHLDQAQIDFLADQQSIHLKQAKARWSGGNLNARGWIFTDKPVKLALHLSGNGIPLAALGRRSGSGLTGTGDGNFSLTVTGNLDDPLVMGTAGMAGILPYLGSGGLSGSFCYWNRSLMLWDADWNSAGGSLAASGLVGLAGTPSLALLLRANQLQLNRAQVSPGLALGATVGGAAYIYGPLARPMMMGSLGPGRINLGSLKGRLERADLGLVNGQMLVAGNLTLDTGNLEFRSTVPIGQSGPLALLLTSPSQDWRKLTQTLPLGIALAGKGGLDLSLVGDSDTGYRLDFHAGLNRGNLALYGLFGSSASSPWILNARADNLSVAELGLGGLKDLKPRGSLTAATLLMGRQGTWNAHARGRFNGTLLGLPINRLFLAARGTQNSLKLEPAVIGGETGTLALTGLIRNDRRLFDLTWDLRDLRMGQTGDRFDFRALGISDPWKGIPNRPRVTGHAWAQGTIRGPWNDPVVQGTAVIFDGMFNHKGFNLAGGFNLTPRLLALGDLHLVIPPGDYRLGGKISLADGGTVDLKFHTRRGQLASLLSFTPWAELPVRGYMDGDLRISGSTRTPLLNGNLALSEVNLGNQVLDRVSAGFSTDERTLHMDPIRIEIKDSVVEGKGYITADDRLAFVLSGHSFPLERIAFLSEAMKPLGGTGDFTFQLSGNWNHPAIGVEFTATDLVLRGTPFTHATGKLTWDGNRLALSPVDATGPLGSYHLEGELTLPSGHFPAGWKQWLGQDAPSLNLNAQVDDADWATIISFLGINLAAPLEGRWDGRLTMAGQFPAPAWKLDLTADTTILGSATFNRVRAEISGDQDEWTVSNLEFSGPGGNGTLTGFLKMDGKVNFTGQTRGLDLGLLAPFGSWSRIMSGKLDLDLQAGGSTQIPDVAVQFTASQPSWKAFKADSITGRITITEGLVNLTGIKVNLGKHTAVVQGEIPLVLAGGRLYSTAPMSVGTSFKDDLSLLKLFLPGLTSTSGVLEGNLALTGMLHEVVLQGDVGVKNGTLSFAAFSPPINNLNARVVLSDNRLDIRNFSGKLGEGGFALSGHIDFSGVEPLSTSLRLNGNDIHLNVPHYLQGIFTTNIALEGRFASPLLSGKVAVRQANIGLPSRGLEKDSGTPSGDERAEQGSTIEEVLFESSDLPAWKRIGFSALTRVTDDSGNIPELSGTLFWASPSGTVAPIEEETPLDTPAPAVASRSKGPSLRFDLDVSAQDNVWLRLAVPVLSANIGTTGDVHIGGAWPEPRLTGSTSLTRGDLTALNATFKVTDGYLRFSGAGWLPDVLLETTTMVSDTQVYMDVTGPLDHPRISLTSSPPLSREDIVKLLGQKLFGTGTTQISSMPGSIALTRTVSYMLISTLLEHFTQTLGKTFALNEVTLDQSLLRTYSITMGKALDAAERFLFTYTRVFGEGLVSNMWGIEYRVARNFILRAAQYETGGYFFWVQGRFQH